jgi:hypothetical protein
LTVVEQRGSSIIRSSDTGYLMTGLTVVTRYNSLHESRPNS